MFSEDLDTRLQRILDEVESEASFKKEALEASDYLKEVKSESVTSELSKKLLKVADELALSDEVTNDDLASFVEGDTRFVDSEKIASYLNAAVGLKLLQKKLN